MASSPSSIDDLTAASAFLSDSASSVGDAGGGAAINHSNWKPITFTLVEYPEGDLIGQLLAWISLAPLCIAGSFIPLIMFRRDLHTITFFLGTLLNECINKALKLWIREPRPLVRNHVHEEFGMPSSHSQFIWFFSTYVTLFVLLRLKHNTHPSHAIPFERTFRALTVLGCWLLAGLVCLSRIYLLYHTQQQVIVGSTLGILNGTAWFAVTHLLLTPIFPYVVGWRFSEFFMVRDTTPIPNILWFEYRITRQEARVRSRRTLTNRKSQ